MCDSVNSYTQRWHPNLRSTTLSQYFSERVHSRRDWERRMGRTRRAQPQARAPRARAEAGAAWPRPQPWDVKAQSLQSVRAAVPLP
eukprot:2199061-Prymnesium_polylepis.1